jgi:hypothetical protein
MKIASHESTLGLLRRGAHVSQAIGVVETRFRYLSEQSIRFHLVSLVASPQSGMQANSRRHEGIDFRFEIDFAISSPVDAQVRRCKDVAPLNSLRRRLSSRAALFCLQSIAVQVQRQLTRLHFEATDDDCRTETSSISGDAITQVYVSDLGKPRPTGLLSVAASCSTAR